MAANRGYQEIIDILGSECAIFPIGDPAQENAARTIVTTKGAGGGDGLLLTYSEARTAFDLATEYTRSPNRIPLVPLNGSDENADTPDIDFFSRVGAPFSIGFWIRPVIDGNDAILSKWDAVAEAREWTTNIDTNGIVLLKKRDQSASVDSIRPSNTAIVAGQLAFCVFTDDGADSDASINIYLHGVLDNGTPEHSGSYDAMEANTGVVELGALNIGAVQLFAGDIAGGHLGPFFTHKELSAPEVRQLRDIGRQYLFGGFPPLRRRYGRA